VKSTIGTFLAYLKDPLGLHHGNYPCVPDLACCILIYTDIILRAEPFGDKPFVFAFLCYNRQKNKLKKREVFQNAHPLQRKNSVELLNFTWSSCKGFRDCPLLQDEQMFCD
jgi:hypothetical protein